MKLLPLLLAACLTEATPERDRHRDTAPPAPECQSMDCLTPECGVPVLCCETIGDFDRERCWYLNASGFELFTCASPTCTHGVDLEHFKRRCGECG